MTAWQDALALSGLPALSELQLQGNPLESVLPAESTQWPVLDRLHVGGTHISSWDSIDAFNSFPVLDRLRIGSIPLFEIDGLGPSQARMYIIARMPGLRMLNGSEVRDREREDAEKAYITLAGEDFAKREGAHSIADLFPTPSDTDPAGKGDNEAAIARMEQAHPRWFILREMYREHVAAAVAAASTTLAANAVSVVIRSMAGASCDARPLEKRLPLSMSVGALKQLAARAFKMEDLAMVRVTYRDSPGAFPAVMDEDLRALSFYGITNGTEILVDEIDATEAAREASERAALQAAAEAAQGATGNALSAAMAADVSAAKAAAVAAARK